jgi:hypothetical protein
VRIVKLIFALPLSCKKTICPSCNEKRSLEWVEWLDKEVLMKTSHRHWTMTIPKIIRWCFRKKRSLLTKLASLAANTLRDAMRAHCPNQKAQPGIISVVSTAGERMQFKGAYSFDRNNWFI